MRSPAKGSGRGRAWRVGVAVGMLVAALAPAERAVADNEPRVATGAVYQFTMDADDREQMEWATTLTGFLRHLLIDGYRGYEYPRQPLAGVLVSDGHSFVETDEQGRYEIELHEEARWVTFINPSGTTPTDALHHRLPVRDEGDDEETDADDEDLSGLDFFVEPLPRSADEPFRFVHQSDMHVLRDTNPEWIYDQLVRHVNRMPKPPAFVLDTGDTANDSIELMEGAKRAFDRYHMPVFVAKGNHDRDRAGREAYRGETIERLYNPLYHAFTHGNYLFINLPWTSFRDEAADWTLELLDRVGDDFHVVVGLHHWDGLRDRYRDVFEAMKRHDAAGALWGHYHTNQMLNVEGVPNIAITAGDSFLRDLSMPSFYVITAHPDGRLVADYRNRGFEHHRELIYPGPEAPLWRGGSSPVQVNAYDTALDVASVRVSVVEHGASAEAEPLASLELDNAGGWAWAGELRVEPDWPSELTLRVEVVDERGFTWPKLERDVPVREADERPSVELGDDWAMAGGGPTRTGAAADSITPPLRLAWVHLNRNFGLSAPIVADGRVFAGVMNNHDPVAPFPAIVALEATTGETLWTHEVSDGRSVRNTLATDGRTLIAHLDDGKILALDADTGEPRWSDDRMTTSLRNAQIFLRASPIVSDGRAYFGLREFRGAFDLETGSALWSEVPDGGGRNWVNPAYTKAGDRLYSPRPMRALDADTGETLDDWEPDVNTGTWVVTFPFADNRVIAAGPGEDEGWDVHALDPDTGETLWRTGVDGWQPQTVAAPAVADGRVFFVFGDAVSAFDADTGEIVWRTEIDSYDVPGQSTAEAAPVVAGDYLYLATVDGRLRAIETGSGEVVWHHDLGAKINSGLAVSGNTLLVTTRAGALYAFVPAPRE